MRGKQPPTSGADSRNRDSGVPVGGVAAPGGGGVPAGDRPAGGANAAADAGGTAGADLIAGILRDAQTEAERLLAEARGAAAERLQAAESQSSRFLEEARAKADAQARSVGAQALSTIRMEDKRTSLKGREEALRRVLQTARERLAAQAGEGSAAKDYRRILLGWIVEAAIGLNVPEAEVRVSAREQRFLDRELLSEAARSVKELTGRDVTLEPAAGDPLVGQGVVLRSADGRLEFNNQVSTRLLRYQSEIRKIVFEALDR